MSLIDSIVAPLVKEGIDFAKKKYQENKSAKQNSEVIAFLRKKAHEYSDQNGNIKFAGRDLVRDAEIKTLLDTLRKRFIADGMSDKDAFRESGGYYGILLNKSLLQSPDKAEFERIDKPGQSGPARYRRL